MSTAESVLDVARGWVGRKESDGSFIEILDVYNSYKPLARGYAITPDAEWCDAFVSACAIKAGAVDLIGTEVSCGKHIEIFKSKGIWIEDGTITPRPGDIVVYNWEASKQPDDTGSDHIGIVEQVLGGSFVTIEGNTTGEAVGRRTVGFGWAKIRGFARPNYSVPVAPAPSASKSVDELAREVIAGEWGNGSDRSQRLSSAGYDANAVQVRVNQLVGQSSAPAPTKSVDEIAHEVLAGKWGNGGDRKTALSKAGYDPDAVQARVNQLASASTPSKSIDTIAREVLRGNWGNGADRRNALIKAGYDPDAVQARVNQLA